MIFITHEHYYKLREKYKDIKKVREKLDLQLTDLKSNIYYKDNLAQYGGYDLYKDRLLVYLEFLYLEKKIRSCILVDDAYLIKIISESLAYLSPGNPVVVKIYSYLIYNMIIMRMWNGDARIPDIMTQYLPWGSEVWVTIDRIGIPITILEESMRLLYHSYKKLRWEEEEDDKKTPLVSLTPEDIPIIRSSTAKLCPEYVIEIINDVVKEI